MTEDQIKMIYKEVDKALKPLTITEKLRVIEKLGKKWRRQNSIEINEEVAKHNIKLMGRRIKDVDIELHKK